MNFIFDDLRTQYYLLLLQLVSVSLKKIEIILNSSPQNYIRIGQVSIHWGINHLISMSLSEHVDIFRNFPMFSEILSLVL